ncbi:unnamed protein product [Closterium sp. Yama58-4]|nr:unnamed protein product [Closterium sp. Yama58-4]
MQAGSEDLSLPRCSLPHVSFLPAPLLLLIAPPLLPPTPPFPPSRSTRHRVQRCCTCWRSTPRQRSPFPPLPLFPPPTPPFPPQSLYEASGAALLHLLAFNAPPALQSVRQAAVRVCARMATAGGRWWRESATGAMLLALSPYVDAPDDHVMLDACTALAASLLALPPQPPFRPLLHAPIPALPSSLLAPPPTALPAPSPSASPLALPLATLTPPLLAALWRLHLSRSAPSLGTHGPEGGKVSKESKSGKGDKGRDGGGARRGGVVARAADWLWGPAGTGDGRGGVVVHAHASAASGGREACGGVAGAEGGSARDDSAASHVAASAWQAAASLLRWLGGHYDPAVLRAAGLSASVLMRALLGGGVDGRPGCIQNSSEEQMGSGGSECRADGGEEQVGGSQAVMVAAWEAVRWMAAFCHVAVCDSEGGVTLVRAKEAGDRAGGKGGESERREGAGGGGGGRGGGGRRAGDADGHAGMEAVAALACPLLINLPIFSPQPLPHRYCSTHLVALLTPSSHATPHPAAPSTAPSPSPPPTSPLHPATAHALLAALLALLSSPCAALASLSHTALSRALSPPTIRPAASREAWATGEGGREGGERAASGGAPSAHHNDRMAAEDAGSSGINSSPGCTPQRRAWEGCHEPSLRGLAASAVRQAALACCLCSRSAPRHSSAPLLTAEMPRQEVEAASKLLVVAALACDGRGGDAVRAEGGVQAVGLVVAARVALWTKWGAGEAQGQGEGQGEAERDRGEVRVCGDDGRKGESGGREQGGGEDEWGWDEGNEAWWGEGELEGGEDEMMGVMAGGEGSEGSRKASGEEGADVMLLVDERPDIPHAPYCADPTAWQGADIILFSALTALLILLHSAQSLPSLPSSPLSPQSSLPALSTTALPPESLSLTPPCVLLPENLILALTRLLHPASPAGMRCLAARCLSLCRSLPHPPPPSAALPAAAKQPSQQQPSHRRPSHHLPATHCDPPPLGVPSAVGRDIRSALAYLSPSNTPSPSASSSPTHASHAHFTPLTSTSENPKAQVAFVLTHPSAPTSTAATSPLRVVAHAAIIAARCPALLSPLTSPSAPARPSPPAPPHSTPSLLDKGKDEGVSGQGMARGVGEGAEGEEGVVREVRLGRGVSGETFSQLLEYIYTGQVSLSHWPSKDLHLVLLDCLGGVRHGSMGHCGMGHGSMGYGGMGYGGMGYGGMGYGGMVAWCGMGPPLRMWLSGTWQHALAVSPRPAVAFMPSASAHSCCSHSSSCLATLSHSPLSPSVPAPAHASEPHSDIVLCVPCARHAPPSPAHQPPASPSSRGEEVQHDACGGPEEEGSGEGEGGQGGVWRCVRVAAHRCVLGARSQYLHALLHCGMRESSQHEVHLPALPLPALIALLRFLYSARVSFLPLPLPPHATFTPTNLNHPHAPTAAASPSGHHSAPVPLSSVNLPLLTLSTRLLSAVHLASLAHQWMLPALHHAALCYVAARLRATWHDPVSRDPGFGAADCSDGSSSRGTAATTLDWATEGPVAPWAAADAVVRVAWAAGQWEMVGEAVSSLAPWYPAMRRTSCLHRLPPQVQSAVREAHVRLLTARP